MRILLLFIVVGFTVGGCGIKPSSVEAPDGVEEKEFPATYPKDESGE